jgi:Cyclophilin type peptidyl-prolyl cis-trans isomerase/CLD
LDSRHTVFGEVAKGFEVLALLNECITDRYGRPYQDIRYGDHLVVELLDLSIIFKKRICHTVILDNPFDDVRGLNYPCKSPEPTDKRLEVRNILE